MKITRKQIRNLILQEIDNSEIEKSPLVQWMKPALDAAQAQAPDDHLHNVPDDEYRRRRQAEVNASSLEPSIKAVLNFILTNMEFKS